MNKNKIVKIGSVLFGLLLPTLVLAAGIIPNNPDNTGVLPGDPSSTFNDQVSIVIRILLGVAGIIAVLFIIIGGFQYITSGANEEMAESGKKTLQNAIVGLIIIILSYVIVVVIARALIFGPAGT